jgi:hypothetical protein
MNRQDAAELVLRRSVSLRLQQGRPEKHRNPKVRRHQVSGLFEGSRRLVVPPLPVLCDALIYEIGRGGGEDQGSIGPQGVGGGRRIAAGGTRILPGAATRGGKHRQEDGGKYRVNRFHAPLRSGGAPGGLEGLSGASLRNSG